MRAPLFNQLKSFIATNNDRSVCQNKLEELVLSVHYLDENAVSYPPLKSVFKPIRFGEKFRTLKR